MSTLPPFIGIDFGTSNSKMAWYNPKTNQAEIILNSEGEPETPSVVYYGENEALVGSHALELLEYEQERERVILSIKRELIATPLLALPGKSLRPTEVASEVLRKLKHDARELHFHQEVPRAVITYPASFGPLERDKIREAARLAGFTEVEMLEEPVAAALAYAQMGLQVGKSVLVYDLGGGTFDLAVLNAEEDGVFRLALEPQGIKRCGGDDFDEALYNHCNKIAQEKLGRPISQNGKRDLHFLQQCRQRKEKFSTRERLMFKSLLEPGAVLFQYPIERATFESLIGATVEETVRKTKALLEQANTAGHAVDTMVLIGGSSRVPLVQRLLEKNLPLKPLQWQNRDLAVALGAAYHAQGKWGSLGSDKAITDQYRSTPQNTSAKKAEKEKVERVIAQPNMSDLSKRPIIDEQYLKAVLEVWSNKKLEKPKVERLTALAKELALSKEQVAQIERGVMGDTKEVIFQRQRREQYLKAVKSAWVDKRLDKAEVERLTALAKELALSRKQLVQIEREVMGDTKEMILTRQAEPIKQPTQKKSVGSTLTYRSHDAPVWDLAWSPDSTRIASSAGSSVVIWDATTGHTYSTYYNYSFTTAWSPDGKRIATESSYRSIDVWDVTSERKISTCAMHSDLCFALAWSPDCTRIVSGEWGGERLLGLVPERNWAYVYNAVTGKSILTYKEHTAQICDVAWSPNGKWIASGGLDKTVQVWDAAIGSIHYIYRGHSEYVSAVAWSPDGKWIASGGNETVQVWDAMTGRNVITYTGHPEGVHAVAWSPDGKWIASGGNDKTVRVWDATTGETLYTYTGHSDAIRAVAWSPDGTRIASGGRNTGSDNNDNTVRIWQAP